jgi:hypothetical protein
LMTLQQTREAVTDPESVRALVQYQSRLEEKLEGNETDKLIINGALEQLDNLRSDLLIAVRQQRTGRSSRSPTHRSILAITGDPTVDAYNAIQELSGRASTHLRRLPR